MGFDPVSVMAVTAVASSALGAGEKAAGAKASAAAQSAAAGYNAQVADQNAQINLQNASLTASEGDVNAATQGQKNRAQIGATLAGQGASGINVNSGSSVNVRASEAAVGQQNVMQIRSDAVRKAYGYQTEAYGDQAQASLDRAAAKNDITAGKINSQADILSGISSVSGGLTNYMQAGGPLAGITSDSSMSLDPDADSSLPWSTNYSG